MKLLRDRAVRILIEREEDLASMLGLAEEAKSWVDEARSDLNRASHVVHMLGVELGIHGEEDELDRDLGMIAAAVREHWKEKHEEYTPPKEGQITERALRMAREKAAERKDDQ
jgi:hypothetical protein